MPGLRVLRKWQAGLEAVRGTGVAATRRFHATGMLAKQQPGFWPKLDVGGFDALGDRQPLLIAASGNPEMQASFEDIAWWLLFGVRGDVVGAQIAATTAYRRTYVPSESADDLKSGTFEWGDDFQAWKSVFGMVDQLTIKGAPGEPLQLSVSLVAKDRVEAAFTAALENRKVETILGRRATLYIDEPAGAIGTTAVAGRLIGFEHTIRNALGRFNTMDDADGGTLSDITRDHREFETKIRYRFNNILEYQKWAANNERLIKVRFVGSDAGGGNLRELSFFLPGRYEDHTIGDQDGATTVEMTLRQRVNAALAYASKYEVVNALAALP